MTIHIAGKITLTDLFIYMLLVCCIHFMMIIMCLGLDYNMFELGICHRSLMKLRPVFNVNIEL